MAHFAKLDGNNLVTQVIVVSNNDTSDGDGKEYESIGIAHCQKVFGGDTVWKQTSYNAYEGLGYRGNYAGIGMAFMSDVTTLGVAKTDVFIDNQPHLSWTVGVNTATWYPPANPGSAPALTDAEKNAMKYYAWNESNYHSNPTTAWVLTAP